MHKISRLSHFFLGVHAPQTPLEQRTFGALLVNIQL